MIGVADADCQEIQTSYAKNDMEFVPCVVFVRENDPSIDKHREFADNEWHFYAIGNIGDSKKTDVTRAAYPSDPNEFAIEVSDNTLPNAFFQTGYENSDGSQIYPITKEQWSGDDGTYKVADKAYLLDQNLGLLYELQSDGTTYALTTDASIDSTKTYYIKNYNSKAYENLYLNWDGSVEFRYDMGGDTKDGMSLSSSTDADKQRAKNRQVWRDFYEFVVTSSDADFKAHLGDYMVLDSALYFYLFTERYIMIDNRAKNTFYHYSKCSDGKYRFEMWDYDNDTALGINNSGEAVFTYGLEDIDKQYTKPNGTVVTGPVFNAADNVLWRRIRDLMHDKLRNMYLNREGVGAWSATGLIEEYDKWQEHWPEKLWELDLTRKYIRPYNGTPKKANADATVDSDWFHQPDQSFLRSMMNGRKKYQRRQFERDQEVYDASKYLGTRVTGDDNNIRFRCNTPTGDNIVVTPNYTLTLTPYSDMYLGVMYGNQDAVQVRAKAGQDYTFTTSQTTMNDTMVVIYGASQISKIGSLAPFYIHDNSFGAASHLTELVIGDDTEGYQNTYLTQLNLGNNVLLQTLNIDNCPNLTGAIDLSKCNNLKLITAKGTSVTSIVFSENGKLVTAYLPSTIAAISLRKLAYLETLDIDTWKNLTSLTVDGTPSVDTLDIIKNALNLTQIRITDVDWSLTDDSLIERLYALKGIDANGNTINKAVLTGKIFVETLHQKNYEKYLEAWGSNVTWTWTTMVQQFDVLFKNQIQSDGTYPLLKATVYDQGTILSTTDGITITGKKGTDVNTLTLATPEKEETVDKTFTFVGWSKDATASATDSSVNVIGAVTDNITLYAIYKQSARTYTVTYKDRDGSVLQKTTDVPYGAYAPYLAAGSTSFNTLQSMVNSFPTDPIKYAEKCKSLVPTYVGGESGLDYFLFTGWDMSGYVDGYSDSKKTTIGDKVITAQYEHNVYTDTLFADKTLETMSPLEIWTAVRLDKAGIHSFSDGLIDLEDSVKIHMGYDVDFADVDSHVYINTPTIFDGKTYIDTSQTDERYAYLFDSNKPWTLAMEYNVTTAGYLLSATDAHAATGMTMQFSTGLTVMYAHSSSASFGKLGTRDLIVLRHAQDSNVVDIYYLNKSGNAVTHATISASATSNSAAPYPLVFGALKNPVDSSYSNYMQGTIYWAKVWMVDLGAIECTKLAGWTHEDMSFKVAKMKNNTYTNADGTNLSLTFIADNTLGVKKAFGSSTYDQSDLTSYVNKRFFSALPIEWQTMIQQTYIEVWEGMVKTDRTKYDGTADYGDSDNMIHYTPYIFMPSYYELDPSSATTEGDDSTVYESGEQYKKAKVTANYYALETGTGDRQSSIAWMTTSGLEARNADTNKNTPYWTRSLSNYMIGMVVSVDVDGNNGSTSVSKYTQNTDTEHDMRVMFSI